MTTVTDVTVAVTDGLGTETCGLRTLPLADAYPHREFIGSVESRTDNGTLVDENLRTSTDVLDDYYFVVGVKALKKP